MDLGEREAGPMPYRLNYGPAGDVGSMPAYLRDWHLWRAIQRDACLTYAERGAVIDAIEERLHRWMAEGGNR